MLFYVTGEKIINNELVSLFVASETSTQAKLMLSQAKKTEYTSVGLSRSRFISSKKITERN